MERLVTREEMNARGDGFARFEAARMLLDDARGLRDRAVTEVAIEHATTIINNLLAEFPELKADAEG